MASQIGDTGGKIPKVFVLDGGFSSQLSRHVGDRVDGDPLWTARFLQTNPDDVVLTHLDFLRAGSDVIMTNTYQASIGGFVKYLGVTPEDAYKLIGSAVGLAKKAVKIFIEESHSITQYNHTPLIVGSVGPYGAHLNDASEYSGNYADTTSKETMIEWHRPRIQALLEAGVDMLALETIPCQKEAEALLDLLKEFPTARAWITFSCKNDKTLAHGEDFQTVSKLCWDTNSDQLVAVGVNCCSPFLIENMFMGINDDRKHSPIPLIVYPNSGEKYNSELGWTNADKCVTLDTFVEKWLDLGVQYVGGCCRTYAEDIALIKKQVQSWCDSKLAMKSD